MKCDTPGGARGNLAMLSELIDDQTYAMIVIINSFIPCANTRARPLEYLNSLITCLLPSSRLRIIT